METRFYTLPDGTRRPIAPGTVPAGRTQTTIIDSAPSRTRILNAETAAVRFVGPDPYGDSALSVSFVGMSAIANLDLDAVRALRDAIVAAVPYRECTCGHSAHPSAECQSDGSWLDPMYQVPPAEPCACRYYQESTD